MDLLGRGQSSISSISSGACGQSATTFAALEDDGTVSLWDTRLKRKRFLAVEKVCEPGDALELLFNPDTNVAFAMAGCDVHQVDMRRTMSVSASFHHSLELAQFYQHPHKEGSGIFPRGNTTLLVDEDGHVIPFDLTSCALSSEVDAAVFGSGMAMEDGETHFGSLPNICCGAGSLTSASKDGRNLLCTVSMDGTCATYTAPRNASRQGVQVTGTLASSHQTTRQILNPPFPQSCTFNAHRFAVGRGDGMYSVYERDGDASVVEVFAAPGHECNSLPFVSWLQASSEKLLLLTCALSGEVSVWDLRSELEAQDDSIGEHGGDDLPPLVSAGDVRDVALRTTVVNCGTLLSDSVALIGDNDGHISRLIVE